MSEFYYLVFQLEIKDKNSTFDFGFLNKTYSSKNNLLCKPDENTGWLVTCLIMRQWPYHDENHN